MAILRVSPGPSGTNGPGPDLPVSAVEIALVGFIIIVALYFGQVVFVPLALAVILSFVLAPPVRVLRRLGLPNSPSVILVVVLTFAVIFGIGALIAQQVASLALELPRYQLTITDKVKALKLATADSGGALERASETLSDLQKELEKPNEATPAPGPVTVEPLGGRELNRNSRPIPVEMHEPNPTPLDQLQSIITVALAPLATAGLTILFVLFLLLQREDVRDRAIRLLGSHDLERSTAAMDDAGDRLSRYFLAMTAINAAYGLIIGTALWALGIPSPALWGVLAMLMRFVPFIGSFIAAAFPVLLAAAVDPGWALFLTTLALFVVGEIVMGNVIEPIVQGNRTGLSPLAIVLSAAFWTLLWGPIGLLLAIPLTVVLVVLGRHVERLEFLHVLLGDTPPLSPPEMFYQRMLAGDPAEPVEQAEKFVKERSLPDYYDDVVVEGLRLAQVDAERGTLDVQRLPDIRDTAEVVIDALSDNDIMPPRKKAAADDNTSEGEADEEAAPEDSDPVLDLVAAVDPETIPDEWRHENAVVCVASRTALDETAALALAQLLEKCGMGAKVLSPDEVKHGTLRGRDVPDGVRLICVSALDVRERSAHARFLVRRLRRSAPDAILLGGFWKLDPEQKRDSAIIDSVAVDSVVHSLKDALGYCLQAATGSGQRETESGKTPAHAPEANRPVAV